jgi:hypothetical protein
MPDQFMPDQCGYVSCGSSGSISCGYLDGVRSEPDTEPGASLLQL